MIYWTYNALLTLTIPIVVPYLLLRLRKRSGIKGRLLERLGFLGTKRPSGNDRLVWFHASSVGEVTMTFPLIRSFCERYPEYRLFLSTMTETGQDTARRLLSDQGTTFYLPLDFPWTVRHVFETLSPRALFIAETEIWPNLLYHCQRNAIPVVLYNGRISDRSFHRYWKFRFFFKDVLRGVTAFGMQSARDAARIVEIGAPPDRVVVTGNLKFDRNAPDISEKEKNGIRNSLGLDAERTLFVAGSTHGGEEEIVLQAFRQLKRIQPSIVLILAPRHLERLAEITTILNSGHFSWIRRSQMSAETFSGEVILLDTLGELERLYSIGTVVFVGKSLVPGGGHNILEPAAFGKPVLFGPHMENFREIAEIMKAEGGGIEVHSQQQLIDQAQRLISDRSYYARVSQAALRAMEKNRGAIENTLNIMEKHLGRGIPLRDGRASF